MKDILGFATPGFIVGIIGEALEKPLWCVLLIAFVTGAISYAGKLLIDYIVQYIKIKRKLQ
jgi:hypothetical protein